MHLFNQSISQSIKGGRLSCVLWKLSKTDTRNTCADRQRQNASGKLTTFSLCLCCIRGNQKKKSMAEHMSIHVKPHLQGTWSNCSSCTSWPERWEKSQTWSDSLCFPNQQDSKRGTLRLFALPNSLWFTGVSLFYHFRFSFFIVILTGISVQGSAGLRQDNLGLCSGLEALLQCTV